MPLDNIAVGDSIKQSTHQAIIDFVNGRPARTVFTANGIFTVPASCPGGRFKVTMCGGGGGGTPGYNTGVEFPVQNPGTPGGASPMCSFIMSGQALGTSYVVTIGAGGAEDVAGGTTSFGTVANVTGGANGGIGGGGGTVSMPAGGMYVAQDSFKSSPTQAYGGGGTAGFGEGSPGGPGGAGIVVVEW